MDQHAVGPIGCQRLEPEPNRILPGRAARNRRQHAQAGDGAVEQGPVLGTDRYQHPGDPRMAGERSDRVAQNTGAAEREILLGQGAAEPATLAGRDDEGVNGGHARTYPSTRGFATARRGIVVNC